MKKHVWAISGVLLIAGLAAHGWAAEPASATPPSGALVQVTQVKAEVEARAVSLTLKATGPFDYTSYRPSENLYVVDLPGVRSSQPGSARVLSSKLVTSYRLLQFATNNRAVLRLEFLLREPITPTVTHEPADTLTIRFGEASDPAKTAMPEVPQTDPSAPSRAKKATAIRNVSLETSAGAAVLVEADGRLNYEVSRAENPPRLVLDFPGTTARVTRRRVNGHTPPVKAVRVGQYQPTVTRVVVDLQEFAEYKVDLTDESLRLLFDSGSQTQEIANPQKAEAESVEAVQTTAASAKAADQGGPASLPVAPEVAKQPATIPAVTENSGVTSQSAAVQTNMAASEKAEVTRAESTTESVAVPTELTQPPASAQAREQRAEEAVPAADVKRPETKPEVVTMSQGSSRLSAMPATLGSLAATAPAIPVAAPAQQQAAQEQQPAPQQAPAPEAAAAQQAPRSKYTGEPISVNLKDVDLKDFFRLIHEISGLNIVVDPAVKGSLTIVLDDVPWDQAIDIVLRNNALGKELEGNVLRLATLETLKREEDTRRDLALARAQAVDPITTTRVLSYAKAGMLKDTLKKFMSPRGELIADDRSNTLIIRDIPMVVPVVDNLIRQLDRKSLQVEIEARVVTASRQFAREIGTQFGFATSVNARTVFGGLLGGTGFASPVIRGTGLPIPPLVVAGGGTTTGNQIPLNVNLPASAPTSGLTFAHSEPNLALDFIISAAESKGIGKLLSKPKVVTQNNVKASVKQGVKIPIQTTINNTISVQFIDVTLRLTVTPQITADNTVFMDIDVENTAIDPGIPRINGIPALDTQSATTQVLVNDGGTVVIGGVIVSNQQINIAQVPLIGSIPVIGHLFKRQKVETNSQELLFFITPKIVPS